MQWPDISSALQNYLEAAPVGQSPTPDFTAAIPVIVNNGELRIYRELDFLATRGTNVSLICTPGSRQLLLGSLTSNPAFTLDDPYLGLLDAGNVIGDGTPTNPMVGGFITAYPYPVVVQRIGLLVGSAWVPLAEVSLDFLDLIWPNTTQVGVPSPGFGYFAMLDHATALIAPTPVSAYRTQVVGTWRPVPMSAANPETWLGDNLSDLFFAACMVEASAFIRNFGAQSDDPRMAVSWETHYQALKAAALEEEQRRKGQGPGWQPFSPTPAAGQRRS